MRGKTAEAVQEQLDKGVIEPASSEWASPVVFVPKRDGTMRFCVDYRKLNECTMADTYPLPRMDDCIDSLGDAAVFSTLDANCGYWQIPVAEEDKDKTCFTTHMGTYRYKRMPFGLRNAPATFQRALDIILSGVRWQICLVYLDDVIIFSPTIETHVEHLEQILKLLKEAGVTLKLSKCSFFKEKVNYLGHTIMPGKLAAAVDTTSAVHRAPFPTDKTKLKSFLGACNVYRRFIKDFSRRARPLNSMLKKGAEPDWFNASTLQKESFIDLKTALTNTPILSLPKRDRPYMLDTDASKYAMGVTLLQQQDESDHKAWSTIGYWSKTFTDTERRYSATERECLSVVWAIRTLRPYVEGTSFVVRSDHDALRWIMTFNDPHGRLARWRLTLAAFDFTVIYRPGLKNQVPDALSRCIDETEEGSEEGDELPCFGDNHVLITTRSGHDTWDERKGDSGTESIDEEDALDEARAEGQEQGRAQGFPAPITREEMIQEQQKDAFCKEVWLSRVKKGERAPETKDGILIRVNQHGQNGHQIIVPESLRARVLNMAHQATLSGHPGQRRMFEKLRTTYYWPQMAADVASTVRNCALCAKNRVRLRKHTNYLKLFPATEPFQSVGIDILGPLTKSSKGNQFLLVITDRFTKLTQVVPLRRIHALSVAAAFVDHWVFKYGTPHEVLSDNGSQFASKFFLGVCEAMGIANSFTSTYHPQTNGQTERYNRTLLQMLRCYVSDHQRDWDLYSSALTYAYNTAIHRSTGHSPFDLSLTKPPAEFSIQAIDNRTTDPSQDLRARFVKRIETTLADARQRLRMAQERYKRDFDRRIRPANQEIKVGDFVFLDPGMDTGKSKLGGHALGPFNVLHRDARTFVIQRENVVERVNSDRVTKAPRPFQATKGKTQLQPPSQPRETLDAIPYDLETKITKGKTWLVDSISAHRVGKQGTMEFLVDWNGPYLPTWEPRTHIPEELISRYLAQQRREERTTTATEDEAQNRNRT